MRLTSFSILAAFLVGCAHQTSRVDESVGTGIVRNNAYHDGNYPPASMQPKLWKEGDDVSRNQLFIQTQADYQFTVAEAYSNEGNHRKSIEAFRAALIYDPNSAVIRMRLATEYAKIGVLTEALEHAESAVKLDSELIEARLFLANLYSSMRMYDSAISEYETVLKKEPNNTEAPLLIGAAYAEQKQYDKAIKNFRQLLNNKNYKTKYLAHYYIGRLYLEKGGKRSVEFAEKSFKKSLKEKENFDEAALGLYSIHQKKGHEEKGIADLREWQNKFGPSAAIAENLAQHYIENEKFDEAFIQLRIVESFSPRDLNIKVKIALVLIERESYQQAVTKLEQIIVQVPESDKIRFYLAAVYEELSNFDQAIENYSEIPPVSVFYSEAVVHRAYLYKVKGQHSAAKSTLEEGLKHRRDIPQFYTLYASILDELKEHPKAVEILQEGVDRFPGHVQIRFFLGSMYDKMGDLEGTIREMRKVTELDDKHVQALNYLAYTLAENRMKLDEAEQLARRALNLEPEDGYVLDTLGWILFRQGKLEESISVLELAFTKQRSESVIAEHLGDAYNSLQLPEKAKKMYNIAARISTDEGKIEAIKKKIATIEQQLDLNDRTPASE